MKLAKATSAVVNRVKDYFTGSSRVRKAELKVQAAMNHIAKMRARYDVAQTNGENAEHWSWADDLSARAANSLPVRRMVRRRARYEAANNSYLAGMLLTLSNDTIGRGPRIRMQTGSKEMNRLIQTEFTSWCREVRLAQKLRTMVVAKTRDGESFAMTFTNKRLQKVWLDFETLEGDQVTTPTLVPAVNHIDGIIFDECSQPETYEILDHHPGDDYVPHSYLPRQVDASQVMHWFREDRSGQKRGISEITPALPLFAMLRRYTLAVVAAAETAADHAAILEAGAGVTQEEADELVPYTEISYARRMMTAVPFGWKLSQLKAEQPTTTYGDFKGQLINEIARCLNMPFNVAAGNSSGYNYSSGRLDHQVYFKSIGITQTDCEEIILDKLFRAWYAEARLITDENGLPMVPEIDTCHRCWSWAWDPVVDIDPTKTANQRLIDLQTGSTNFQKIYGDQGLDWEVEQQHQADALGITLKDYRALLRQKLYGSALAGAPPPMQGRRRRVRGARGFINKVGRMMKRGAA